MEKQYLISFLATIQGSKVVKSELINLEKTQNKMATATNASTKSTQAFDQVLMKSAKRALIVAPVWLLLRSTMMLLLRTVTDAIKAYIDFEDELARIQTVVIATASDVTSQMDMIRTVILDTAYKSSISIKELAETFYFLQTAGLNTEEALSAFRVTTQAMVGTGVKAKEMARAIAGAYNNMEQALGDNLTVTEKFKKISDALTYTFATQDVEMAELVQSFGKFAPYTSKLDDSFIDLVTTLGFLNTRMLRGGRAGRLLGRSVIQLTKNADKLSGTFGITFDPNQPLNLVNTLEQLENILGNTTQLTVQQGQALQRVFATRGEIPIDLLIKSFEGYREAIIKARTESEGFTAKLEAIRMDTVAKQASRFKNILNGLFIEMTSGIYGVGTLGEALKEINNGFESLRSPIKKVSNSIGYLLFYFRQAVTVITTFTEAIDMANLSLGDFTTPVGIIKNWKKIGNTITNATDSLEFQFKTFEDYEKIQEEIKKNGENNLELLKKSEGVGKELVDNIKRNNDSLKANIELLKVAGISEISIAKYKLQQLQTMYDLFQTEELENQVLTARNQLVLAEAQTLSQVLDRRKGIRDTVRDTLIDLEVSDETNKDLLKSADQVARARERARKGIGGAEEVQRSEAEFALKLYEQTKKRTDLEKKLKDLGMGKLSEQKAIQQEIEAIDKNRIVLLEQAKKQGGDLVSIFKEFTAPTVKSMLEEFKDIDFETKILPVDLEIESEGQIQMKLNAYKVTLPVELALPPGLAGGAIGNKPGTPTTTPTATTLPTTFGATPTAQGSIAITGVNNLDYSPNIEVSVEAVLENITELAKKVGESVKDKLLSSTELENALKKAFLNL